VNKRLLQEYLSPVSSQAAVIFEDSADLAGNKTKAYLYKWTHLPTNKWYIGSRTKKGCYPGDGYICSSKVVKPMILENANHWLREILLIGDPLYIREMENALLIKLDAKHCLASFNQHNGDGKFTTVGIAVSEATREKRSRALLGIQRSDDFKRKVGNRRRGAVASIETRAKIGAASKGRVQSEDARLKNSIAHSGENNHFYGKQHTAETKAKISKIVREKHQQKQTPKLGFWVSPVGERFIDLASANACYPNHSITTIRVWCRGEKNGWSFDKKEIDGK
jgi:hypothetical protein